MSDVVTILVTFHIRPGAKEEFVQRLEEIVHAMSQEETFVNSFVTESLDDPNLMYNYETWRESKESFLAGQFTRAYRASYEEAVPRLLSHREITWLSAPVIERSAGTSAAVDAP